MHDTISHLRFSQDSLARFQSSKRHLPSTDGVMVSTRGATQPKRGGGAAKATTQEQISFSLLDILDEVIKHVPVERRSQVELLRTFAQERPEAQHKIKEQMRRAKKRQLLTSLQSLVLGSALVYSAPIPDPTDI